jgi:hypothetical protein
MTITNPMFPPPLVPAASPASRRSILFGIAAAAAAGPAVALPLLGAAAVPSAETPLPGLAPAVATPLPKMVDERFPDAALVKLINEYLTAHEEKERLDEIIERASKEQEARYPMPDELRVRPEDAELEIPDHNGTYDGPFLDRSGRTDYHDGRWIGALRRPQWKRLAEISPPKGEAFCHHECFDPSPAARVRADEIVAAYDEWWPKVHRRTAASGIVPRLPRGFRAVEKQSERLEALLDKLETKINKTRARTFVGLMAKARIADLARAHDDTDPVVEALLRDALAMGESFGWPGCTGGKPLYLKKIAARAQS